MAQKTVQQAFDAVAAELDAITGGLEDINEALADAASDADLSVLEARVGNLENLGHYLGTSATRAGLPATVAAARTLWGANITPTINDYADILADETQNGKNDSYRIISIDAQGNITWASLPFRYYSDDTSGFMQKQPGATAGNLAKFDANGSVIDSGKAAGDFAAAEQGLPAGGAAGDVLIKSAAANYAAAWGSLMVDWR